MPAFTIELGAVVESNINKFKGMVTSRSEHLNGCNRYWVSPPIDKDGKLADGYWFDEGELVVREAPTLKRKNNERGGMPSQKF